MVGCRSQCADCLRDGEQVPAGYSCLEPKCDLKPVCDGHSILHKRWGHAVSVLVGSDDDDGAPAASILLGVTHCPKPEHAGAEGALTLVCKQCEVLLCQGCMGTHVDSGHKLVTVETACVEATTAISAALPELRQGLTHQAVRAAQARGLLEALAANRSTALEALAAATARLHAEVDAKHAALAREIDAVYDAQVAALQRELAATSAGVAELATVIATGEAALDTPTASSVMRVHVWRSMEASLALAACRAAVDAGLSTLRFEAAGVGEGLALGAVVAAKHGAVSV